MPPYWLPKNALMDLTDSAQPEALVPEGLILSTCNTVITWKLGRVGGVRFVLVEYGVPLDDVGTIQ